MYYTQVVVVAVVVVVVVDLFWRPVLTVPEPCDCESTPSCAC